MSNTENIYMRDISESLPRILSLFNQDASSRAFGVGDRFYWAWKLIDFGNGTFQGAAHGLARLTRAGLLPDYISQEKAMELINSMFQGARFLTRKNGSMEESFPYESSFCVTALVAFDLLCTVELLENRINQSQKEDWLSVVEPMISFIYRTDENHAFISNHLATAAAACFRWESICSHKGDKRGRELLDLVLKNQSTEGWFSEYGGADPGYQTLATYYLADIHRRRPDLDLLGPLRKSIQFLWYFAHPDGSFGGMYGSRNTQFYYPAGLEALRHEIPEAAALAEAMEQSILDRCTVTLSAMDEPNLIPMFNAYCWAAEERANRRDKTADAIAVPPCKSASSEQKFFPEAGILIDWTEHRYTIMALRKGGVCCSYAKDDGQAAGESLINCGSVVQDVKGRLLSAQIPTSQSHWDIGKDEVIILNRLSRIKRSLPTPLSFILLRVAALSILRMGVINQWIKKALVGALITRPRTVPVTMQRKIVLKPASVEIRDCLQPDNASRLVILDPTPGTPFSAIHMASQGYWKAK